MLPRILATVIVLLALLASGCGRESVPAPEPIAGAAFPTPPEPGKSHRFASVSANVLRTNRQMRPILRYLEAAVGERFELVYCRTYRDIILTVDEGRCEFAWMSPRTYLSARATTGCEPLVKLLSDGRPTYEALLVAGASVTGEDVFALKGKRLALVNRSSTSGYAYPSAYFHAKGIRAEEFFSRVSFEGSHENALMAVIRGLADAACIEESVLRRLAGKVDVASVRVIDRIGKIPNGPIVAQKTVPEDLRAKVAAALVALSTAEAGRPVMEGMQRDGDFTGFGPASDADYDEVRRVAATVGLEN